ncbi:MAG: carbohydrate ABC transporter permease [Oscillospiraceae bacterium]|jgi:multiple sugar transport system permease protein
MNNDVMQGAAGSLHADKRIEISKPLGKGGREVPSGVKPWLFLIPTLVPLAFWMIKPLFQMLIYVFDDWNMVPGTEPEFVGFQNFIDLFRTPDFGTAIGNTFYYILMMMPFSVILPVIIAALLQQLPDKAQRIFRALILTPLIMPPVATSTVFSWLFNQTNGLVNHVLVSMGLLTDGVNFFMTEGLARFTISLITGWKTLGFAVLMYSAAITSINPEYYEAAKMDGAGGARRFLDITIPLLSPTVMLMIMMSILFASQWTFAYIDVLTQGGPYGTTSNFYYLIYTYAFGNSSVGLSAAASLVFIVIFGIIAVVLQKISRKLAFYDN